MLEPLAPPWPTPLMTPEEYQAFHNEWRLLTTQMRDQAEQRLEVMTDVVRKEHPDWQIATQLFDMGSQVGIVAGLEGHYRQASRKYVQGFTTDSLRKAVRELVQISASKPYG